MKLSEAKAILTPPLIFGDARQIEAHEFLIKVEEAKERIHACARDHRVFKGQVKNRIMVCECLDEWEDEADVKYAAIEAFIAEVES